MITKCSRQVWSWVLVALVFLSVPLVPTDVQGVRVVTYNILNFPGSTGSSREDDFRTVIEQIDPDVLVVQEILSQSGVNQFLNNVMNYSCPGTYAAAPFTDGYDTDNALFYKVSEIDFISTQQIPTALRDISEYVVKPVGYQSPDAEFRVYSFHLKAGSTTSDKQKRLAEATILRNHLDALPAGTHFILGADLNIRSSSEQAYQKLVATETSGQSKDPIDTPGSWYNNYSFRYVHTQSPRTTSFGGGATGGMDDRFDQILVSYSCDDNDGFSFVEGSYVSYGNDGMHFNKAINEDTNYAVGAVIADALHEAADHLPVYADFQVPAKIDAVSSLDFGTVITGATSELLLGIENVADQPGDSLDYDLTPPAFFTAPGGSFSLAAGESAEHTVSMNTSAAGTKSGDLTITSNDLDYPDWDVWLEGTVLDHARPSLNESVVTLSDTADFGTHPIGSFSNQIVDVFNVGYCGLQSALEVHSFELTGSNRFDFVSGFSPQTAASEPATYTIAFDDAGAADDSLYAATLTLQTRDDSSIPGWIELDDVVLYLEAYVQEGTAAVEPDAKLVLGMETITPNPFSEGVSILFSLPRTEPVTVQVYDVSGRLIKNLAGRTLASGTHEISWDGRDEGGRNMPSGLYFVRAQVGNWNQVEKFVLIR